MGIARPIVLNFGTNFDLVKRLDGVVTVYYCVDPSFPDAGHENDEALTCAASNLVYAVSETYRQHLASLCTTQHLHVIPHGYAFEHARRIAEDSAVSCPGELQALPRPILGFVGSVHDAYVDIDRVERLARQRPEASIVLIGPYRNNPLGPDLSSNALRRLRQLPNVHLLGPRHFLDVPRYVKYFDVCLVLVNVKDYAQAAMTQKRTHFKWLAYLAMGKPIVAPRVNEADSISSLVYLAGDDDSYIAAVDQAVSEDRGRGLPRISYASQFSFDRTLDSIAEPIARFLRTRAGITDAVNSVTHSSRRAAAMTDSGARRTSMHSAAGNPEVSVGLPVYNGEQYLGEAVQSICEQTFADFELIISDNASTDRTAEICRDMASRDSRIRYMRQPRNIGAARNFDFVARAANGKFLKWTTANDRSDRTMLAKCVDVLQREDDAVLCYGRTCLIDGSGNELGLYEYDLSFQQSRPSERFISVRNRMNMNNAQQGLIRLQALRQTRLERSYPDGDMVMMAELALYGTFRLLPDVLLYRRMEKGAASRFLSDPELRAFLDPDFARKGFTAWRRHWDCCWSVLRAPIAWKEKTAALDFVARSAYWDRRELWRDLFKWAR